MAIFSTVQGLPPEGRCGPPGSGGGSADGASGSAEGEDDLQRVEVDLQGLLWVLLGVEGNLLGVEITEVRGREIQQLNTLPYGQIKPGSLVHWCMSSMTFFMKNSTRFLDKQNNYGKRI